MSNSFSEGVPSIREKEDREHLIGIYETAVSLLTEGTGFTEATKASLTELLVKGQRARIEKWKDVSPFTAPNLDLDTIGSVRDYLTRTFPKVMERIPIEKDIAWAKKTSTFDDAQRIVALQHYQEAVDALHLTAEEATLFEWYIQILPDSLLRYNKLK